jgi:hypothetical protein
MSENISIQEDCLRKGRRLRIRAIPHRAIFVTLWARVTPVCLPALRSNPSRAMPGL